MSASLGSWALLALALYGLVAAIEQLARMLRLARSRSGERLPAVIVLIHNRADQVEGLVEWLVEFCRGRLAELVLLDLDSTDETPLILERLGRRHPGIRHARLNGDRAWESALFLSRSPVSLVLDLRQPVTLGTLRSGLLAIWK